MQFARFDEELAEIVLDLLTLPGRPRGLPCGDDRLNAFKLRLRLPTRFNGAGLMGVHGVGPAAFLGSVIASCDEDPVLAANIAGGGGKETINNATLIWVFSTNKILWIFQGVLLNGFLILGICKIGFPKNRRFCKMFF